MYNWVFTTYQIGKLIVCERNGGLGRKGKSVWWDFISNKVSF